jgi:two-component system, chemotaxis family, protein-glutamate methylesterase/glutaminase
MDERPPSLVVMGGSAGGIEALRTVAAGLPADLGAAVGVVVHLRPGTESRLAQILSRAGPLQATQAVDGARLRSGCVYVAPPDRHLIVRDSHCVVTHGPHENGARPSVDVLFRSAALAYGARTVAVVLSGARDDGAAGASAVEARGGTVIVQDPRDALFPGMPESAVARDHPDRVLPLDSIASAVVEAVEHLSREAPLSENPLDEMSLETEYAALEAEAFDRDGPTGQPSAFSCPACGGVLWEVDDTDLLRFRCRVGHAFTAESALDGQADDVERALWMALRALRERAHLSERIASRSQASGAVKSAQRFETLAREAREQADVIRRVLAGRDAPSG